VAILSPSLIIGGTAGVLESFVTTVHPCAGAVAKVRRCGKRVKAEK
jgi:hypothetical protein